MALAFGFDEEMKKSFEDLKKKVLNNNSEEGNQKSGSAEVDQNVSEEKKC